MNMYRGAVDLLSNKFSHFSDAVVLERVNVLPPSQYLAKLRLRYFHRMLLHGPLHLSMLLQLVAEDGRSFTAQLRKDLAWFSSAKSPRDQVPDSEDLQQWCVFLLGCTKKRWKAMLNRATQIAITRNSIKARVDSFHKDIHIYLQGGSLVGEILRRNCRRQPRNLKAHDIRAQKIQSGQLLRGQFRMSMVLKRFPLKKTKL